MKGKFMTGILTLAVLLGLLLVPAMGVSAEPPDGKATFQMPAEVKVLPDTPFDVDVNVWNPHKIDLPSAGIDVMWSAANLLNVTAIDNSEWPSFIPAGCDWDNTTGELWASGGGSTEIPTLNSEYIRHCTIHFVAGSEEGIVTVNFNPSSENGETLIYNLAVDDICDWTPGDMQNMTVIIGTPKLTVDVVGNGTVTVTPPADWNWNDTVYLDAVADVGWAFFNWTGATVANSSAPSTTVTMNTVDMDMDTLTKSVTANFEEQAPKLSVAPLSLPDLSARFGDNTDSDTVTISNTGGHLLNWTASRRGGSAPTWAVGDTWTYYEMYEGNPNYIPGWGVNNTPVVIAVTGDSDPSNYTGIVDFVYDAQRSMEDGAIVATMHNATILVDKATLDNVEQVANVTILFMEKVYDVQAKATWDYEPLGVPALPHGWPYELGKSWWYNMSLGVYLGETSLLTSGPYTMYAFVNGTKVVSTPIGDFTCWEIIHVEVTADPYHPENGIPFKSLFWSGDARNFVLDVDGGTYDAPPPYIRSLLDMSPPAWLRIDPLTGSLGIEGSQPLTATVYSAGLDVGIHEGSFTISAPGSIQEKTVNVTFEVLEATTIDVCRTISLTGDSNKPGETIETYPGETFNVTVTFKSPIDDFNAISLTDLAPAGWEVYTERGWSKADDGGDVVDASEVRVAGNKVEIAWDGPFNATTSFTALYQVTVPETAIPGVNTWPDCDMDKAWAEYWYGPQGPYTSYVMGKKGDCDSELIATVPGDIVGETRDVNANPLPNVDVALYRVGDKFTTSGDGIAEWSTEKVKFGSYSAKLTVPVGRDATDETRVVIPYSGKVSTITEISYWWIEESGNTAGYDYPQVPYLIIELDTDGDTVADTWLAPYRDPAPLTIPTPWTEQITTHDGGTLAHPGFIQGLISDYDAYDVLAIKVMIGCWDDPYNTVETIGYVDDITINGITYELESSEVALRSDESTPDYSDTAYITGEYWLWATKDRYFPLLTKPEADGGTMLSVRNPPHPYYLDFSTPKLLSEGYSLNFSGDYGLIPTAPSMSYAMESINHYLFTPIEWIDEEDFVPRPEWKLSVTKAGDVIAAWQVPS